MVVVVVITITNFIVRKTWIYTAAQALAAVCWASEACGHEEFLNSR